MICRFMREEVCACSNNMYAGGKCVFPDQCAYYEEKEQEFITIDSGKREAFDSGMERDTTEGKMRPDLMFPLELSWIESIASDMIDQIATIRGSDFEMLTGNFMTWLMSDDSYMIEYVIRFIISIEGKGVIGRLAGLYARGAKKYSDRNWEKAEGQAELDRGKQSAFRHFVQYLVGDTDEDHICAVLFNMQLVELVKYKMSLIPKGEND